MYSFFHGDFKQENEVCSFLNTIYYGTTENQYAVIAINIREETVESCYNNLKTGIGEESFLSNRNGGIVSFSGNKFPDEWMDIISKAELTTSDSGFKNLEIGKKKYELYWTKNRNTGGFLWKLRETDQDILAWSPWVYTGVLLGIVSLSILSCLYVWERYINRPLRELSKSMDTIQQGDLEVLTLSEGKDEIGSLMAGFNEMVVRLKNLIDKVYKEQILRQKAELDLMTTQINPHFLYNTIDSIHWTALAQGDEEVGEQLEVLSDFLRGSLNFGRQEVSLKEELELVDNYCYLVQKRFHGRIDFQQQVDKQAYEMAVPKLIVQLLIENAFSHGLKHRFENGKIKLCIHIRKDRLVIKVGDNGLGCDEYEIRKELEKTESARCFALLNVKQRLELLYGADGKFRFYSRKNQGTLVSIQIPATRKEF